MAAVRKGAKNARRPSARSIRAARTYTIEEAAQALGLSLGTIRLWTKAGLPIMKAQRPYLILGESLKTFLQDRSKGRKTMLGPDQLYCLTCKQARIPMGLMVDCIPQTTTTARLVGLCETCGGTCNRMISRAEVGQFREIFALAERGGKTA